jgi:hypothetical protein
VAAKLAISACVELAFNVFPATPTSSAALQAAQLSLLVALAATEAPELYDRAAFLKSAKEAKGA